MTHYESACYQTFEKRSEIIPKPDNLFLKYFKISERKL